MKIFGLVVTFVIIAAIDIPSMAKKTTGKFKYFVVYGFILIISFAISLLQFVGKAPASPSTFIQNIVKGIMGDM